MVEFLSIFGFIIVAALLGGSSAGLLGVFVIGLRMPFIAVFSAHSALAGAVFGGMIGISSTLGGFIGALFGAVLLGIFIRDRNIDPNTALGTLFSLMLGVAFLGIGLTGGPKSQVLGLMWGSLLFVTGSQIVIMGALTIVLVGFIFIAEKELKALLFSRQLAALMIPEWIMFSTLLVLAAGIITINLQIVGGLLLYSLIANPAVAAFRLARSFRSAMMISVGFGALSALGGFLAAYWLDLPVGACIVLFSSLILGISFRLSPS
jgi:manganese/iron transport system permease protein